MSELQTVREDPYVAIQIDEDTWRIEETMVRFFLFVGSERALLVDTGFGTGDLRSLLKRLTDKEISVVLTHADPDHRTGSGIFSEVRMHPAEFAHYRADAPDGPALPAPVWESDVIDIGGRRFEAVHVPGHTPGSIALLDRERRVLVSGDNVATSAPVFLTGIWRSPEAYLQSLKKLEGLTGAYDTLYPSHGDLPLPASAVAKQLEAAEQLLAGALEPHDPPKEYNLPAKLYIWKESMFLR